MSYHVTVVAAVSSDSVEDTEQAIDLAAEIIGTIPDYIMDEFTEDPYPTGAMTTDGVHYTNHLFQVDASSEQEAALMVSDALGTIPEYLLDQFDDDPSILKSVAAE